MMTLRQIKQQGKGSKTPGGPLVVCGPAPRMAPGLAASGQPEAACNRERSPLMWQGINAHKC